MNVTKEILNFYLDATSFLYHITRNGLEEWLIIGKASKSFVLDRPGEDRSKEENFYGTFKKLVRNPENLKICSVDYQQANAKFVKRMHSW